VSPHEAARDITRGIAAALPDPAARVAVVPVEVGDEALLSDAERERAGRFRFPKRRGDWTAGRVAAKLALREALGDSAAAEELTVATGLSGEPVVTAVSFGVSISHAGGMAAAVAFPCDRPIGIDLEPVTAVDPGLATLACNDREHRWLAARPADQINDSLLRIWTAKEAAVKLTRTGLGVPLARVELDPKDSELTELEVRLPGAVDGSEAVCRVRVISMASWVAALAWFARPGSGR
jgi:phosphopantetheinyl transferase